MQKYVTGTNSHQLIKMFIVLSNTLQYVSLKIIKGECCTLYKKKEHKSLGKNSVGDFLRIV